METVAQSGSIGSVDCPHCNAPLQLEPPADRVECPRCRRALTARIFPRFTRPEPALPQAPSTRALEGEATCFFHPEKTAAAACERCGRFICSLCDIPLGTRHLCPSCLSRGLEGSLPELVRSRVCWGHISLLLGLIPILGFIFMWPAFPFTGAAAIFTALYGHRRPPSLVHGKQRAAAIAGSALGLIQILAGAAVVVFIWRTPPNF